MSPLRLGNTEIDKLYIGSTEVDKLYLGETEVYGSLPPGAEFTWERDSSKDIRLQTRSPANTNEWDIWSDGSTMWVCDWGTVKRAFAYNLGTGARDSAKDLNLPSNHDPSGICSHGDSGTIYITGDSFGDDDGIWVHKFNREPNGRYTYDNDYAMRVLVGRQSVYGVWCNSENAYVLTSEDGASLRRLNFTSRTIGEKVRLPVEYSAGTAIGLWSDGRTLWYSESTPGTIVRGLSLESLERDSSKDSPALQALGNNSPGGLWSDGSTMWVVNRNTNVIMAYS